MCSLCQSDFQVSLFKVFLSIWVNINHITSGAIGFPEICSCPNLLVLPMLSPLIIMKNLTCRPIFSSHLQTSLPTARNGGAPILFCIYRHVFRPQETEEPLPLCQLNPRPLENVRKKLSALSQSALLFLCQMLVGWKTNTNTNTDKQKHIQTQT